ncbi:hypothetical protein N7468_004165 [Penicillium chermesinum]|uniref:Zn(2)-C6 fungal-type domain-containing protein n=1 Tax=Penicillium chermesinum TaxID=63820 RepID=A0A9W9P8M0_9EURO|nr:uncharacterized protein N7468_004165 [Penicillium chermesinum]KAJ5239546.1 hypothetical protein N7468_004165 [Penicillium chermesinum]
MYRKVSKSKSTHRLHQMGTIGQPFRAIKPRNDPGEGSSGQLPAGSSGGGPPPADGRCSGQPCSECQTHTRECVFDKLSDRRRKATVKKTQEELTSLQEFMRELLGALRSSDGTLAQHTLDTIRAGASEDEILASIRHA